MNKKIALLLLSAFLAGCNDKDQLECSSPVSTQTLIDVLKKSAMEQINPESMSFEDVTNGIKRSALEKVQFSVADITTNSKDPNSSLRTCSATVSIKIDPQQYQDLSEFYRVNYRKNIDKFLESLSLTLNTNVFSSRINYTAQPTDDNKTVFIETAGNNGISSGAAFISTITIVKPLLEQQKIEQAKQQQAQVAQQALAQQQAEAAAQQQIALQSAKADDANATTAAVLAQPAQVNTAPSAPQRAVPVSLNEVRNRFMDADKQLGTAWHGLGSEKQKALLSQQRQWIKNKEAICGKISMKGSEAEMTNMFECQLDFTNKRIVELEQAR